MGRSSVYERAHTQVLSPDGVNRSLRRISHEILERNASCLDDLALVGVLTRGVPLAQRISANIRQFEGIDIPVGSLDITLHRDDKNRDLEMRGGETAKPLAPHGYERVEGGRLRVGDRVWNIGGDAKNGSVPTEPVIEEITNITKAAPSNGQEYVNLHLSTIGTSASKRTRFLSKARMVYAKAAVPFDVTGKTVVLCDDVLYTGRTARAAMDALLELGRPAAVRLAILVDRGHRELPIRADHVGKNVPTARGQRVLVNLEESDGEDGVIVVGD